MGATRSQITAAAHLPCEAVALAVEVSKVCHFAVLDVHPGFSHSVLSHALASLAAVGDELRDGADERSGVVVVYPRAVVGGIPAEHLRGAAA